MFPTTNIDEFFVNENAEFELLLSVLSKQVNSNYGSGFAIVLDSDGKIKTEIYLSAEQTKGSKSGTVFVSDKLRKELQAYVKSVPYKSITDKLFYSQKRPIDGWNSNTLCQFFHYLFKNCGIDGASSHSPRRTAITNLADKGVSVRVLQSIARHANISTTQCYIDVNDDMKRKAVELA